MPEIPPDLRAQLAALTDAEWTALSAQVRAPDIEEQLRTSLSKHISGDRLEAILKVANPAAFVDENGALDEAKVVQSLGGLFGTSYQAGPTHQDFGQYTPAPPHPGPGDRGAAEAAKRFGTNSAPPPAARNGGALEAERRFGKKDNG